MATAATTPLSSTHLLLGREPTAHFNLKASMPASSLNNPSSYSSLGAASISAARASFVALRPRVEEAWQFTWRHLADQVSEGHWTGELSTSALSTATAVSALSLCRKHHCLPREQLQLATEAIETGCHWLANHQNVDGGFGDTDRSHSNIATSLLVQAAWQLAEFNQFAGSKLDAAKTYIESVGKWDALKRRYGKDKTFVVPILTNCALAGLAEWNQIPALPFEAAWLPQSWYRLARMPVVSYAVPALVAMGQAKFHFQPPLNPLIKWFRRQAIRPTLQVLAKMQPHSGGYLEAVPLTSFVLMSLAAIGKGDLPVSQHCMRFLFDSRLSDGSWPIDTNLATWLTSSVVVALKRRSSMPISVSLEPARRENASGLAEGLADLTTSVSSTTQLAVQVVASEEVSLSGRSVPQSAMPGLDTQTIRWLLSCQHQRQHPFTGARPGGWGWTDLSGAVPDADDTPAALLALAALDLSTPELGRLEHQSHCAAAAGLRWLTQLQNRDGGWPTFCRGWGKLPFDRSGTDLTAHALRAFHAWLPQLSQLEKLHPDTPTRAQILSAMRRGQLFLQRRQQPDGSWFPLWFGNQDNPAEENPIYGTAKVLLSYAELSRLDDSAAQCGIDFLVRQQNPDGGWGGGPSVPYRNGRETSVLKSSRSHVPGEAIGGATSKGKQEEGDWAIGSSIEETALALEALVQCGGVTMCTPTIMRGCDWLATAIQRGNLACSWPIGFYFAKLWYHEKLYPAIFSLGAMGAVLQQLDIDETGSESAG